MKINQAPAYFGCASHKLRGFDGSSKDDIDGVSRIKPDTFSFVGVAVGHAVGAVDAALSTLMLKQYQLILEKIMSLMYIDLVADVDSFKKSRRSLFVFSLAWLAVQKISMDFSDFNILGIKIDVTRFQISTIFWIVGIYLAFVFSAFMWSSMREYNHTMEPKLDEFAEKLKNYEGSKNASDRKRLKYELSKLKDSLFSFVMIGILPLLLLTVCAFGSAVQMWF